MCGHYQNMKEAELLLQKFGVTRPDMLGKYDMWPRYQGLFVRWPPEHDAGTRPDALPGAEKLSTFNARDDRAAHAFTLRNAWRRHNARLPPQASNYPSVAFAECICVHHIKQRSA